MLLLLGDFHQGWKEYEWRLKCSNFSSENRNFPQPYWDGIYLNGKSVLIWAEQGIGDEILHSSMINDLYKIHNKISLIVDPRLVELFQRSFKKIKSAFYMLLA